MKTAKIGAIFLIAVMALAGVGAGYAAWFDTITVHGTVNTGDVSWHVVEYSGTDVYKVYNNDGSGPEGEILVWDWPAMGSQDDGLEAAQQYDFYERISWSGAEAGNGNPFDVEFSFNNLFPCIDFEINFVIEYTGSIPGKINFMDYLFDGDAELLAMADVTLEAYGMYFDDGNLEWVIDTNDPADIGYQMHEFDRVIVILTVHLPQENVLMNQNAEGTAIIEVVQWNEQPHAPQSIVPPIPTQ